MCQKLERRLACLKMHLCPGTGISNRVLFLFITIYYSTVSVHPVKMIVQIFSFLFSLIQAPSILTGGLQNLSTYQSLLFQISLG